MAYFQKSCKKQGISNKISNKLLQSISKETLETYERFWRKFYHFSREHGPQNFASINLICEFLISLFEEGLSSSSLNSARSALSFFLSYDITNLAEEKSILRLFKYFYREKPQKAKYLTYWPVTTLLKFLSSLHPASKLTLKQLTLKTLALIALTCSDRGQTLHLMDLNKMAYTDEGIDFVIFDRLKTTRKVLKPKVITCLKSDTPSLNVCEYVKAYLEKTECIRQEHTERGRPKPTKLFLSWATKKPVTRQTQARWLKLCLKLAGINADQFSAHSFRGAGLSNAYKNGASIEEIVKAGSWTNVETFKRHYFAPESSSGVGKIILSALQSGKAIYENLQNNSITYLT